MRSTAGTRTRQPITLMRLLTPRWPPIAALCLAALVFLGVLLTTPPGLLAPVLIFTLAPLDLGSLSAAYAAGAAASLALLTLVILAPLFAVVDVLVEVVSPMDPSERPFNLAPMSGQEAA